MKRTFMQGRQVWEQEDSQPAQTNLAKEVFNRAVFRYKISTGAINPED